MENSVALCSVDWCDRIAKVRDMCPAHDMRRRRGADLEKPFRSAPNSQRPKCSAPNCASLADCAKNGAVCAAHRIMHARTGQYFKTLRGANLQRTCIITGCDKPAKSRLACNSHTTRCTMYSLSVLQLDAMLNIGRCALCNQECSNLQIDHDHSCCPGERSCGNCIRGALCPPCNLGLGSFRDNPERLMLAVKYLSR